MREPNKFAAALATMFLAMSVTTVAAAGDDHRDAALTERVKTALAGDSALKARDIEVETRDGVVQLSGFVDSEDQRTAALLRARSVQGVQEVRNDLSLRDDARPTERRPVADTVIAAKVRNSLQGADLRAGSDVNVEVSKGVVQLSGFVSTPQEKARAGDLASEVEGVRDVENQIALTDEPEPRQH
jgi:hyperosmotically inducible protein